MYKYYIHMHTYIYIHTFIVLKSTAISGPGVYMAL